jgi:hypothetical protein
MSIEQRIKISCDNFDCTASISSGVGLTDARTLTGAAGWVNTVHTMDSSRRHILQDFCPDHREQAFDWATWQAREAQDHPISTPEGQNNG